MKIGAGKELITPNVLTKMAGFASRKDRFNGIHDDLHVKTNIIQNNNKTLILICYEILQFNRSLNDKMQNYIKKNYNIPKEQVVISYTHTHAGPEIKHYLRDGDTCGYEDFLFQRTKSSIKKAFLNVFEGKLYYKSVNAKFGVNRRRKTNDGVNLAPNYQGITDDKLNLFIAKDKSGNIRSIIYNYSCHPVSLMATLYLSAEYPGRVNQLLEAEYYGCMTTFLQGAAGNINPFINAEGAKFKGCSFEETNQMAKSMVVTIKNVINKGEYQLINPILNFANFEIPLEVDAYTRKDFEDIAKNNSTYKAVFQDDEIDYNHRPEKIHIHAGLVKLTEDMYIAYMGGEICYEIKLIIKSVLKGKKLIFFGYNEALTYVPTDKLVKEGGYEGKDAQIYAGLKGPFKPGIDKTILEYFTKYYNILK